jgi:hypothetical protein
MMTIAEQIIKAVSVLVSQEGKTTFTPEEIRQKIGVDREHWQPSYSPILQGMRIDQPGGAPKLGRNLEGSSGRLNMVYTC